MVIFTSRQEIIDYLKISRRTFVKFVRMGMPVVYIDGRCYAHRENIEAFFKRITNVNMQNAPEEIIDSEISEEI
jgi:hypothetical protein